MIIKLEDNYCTSLGLLERGELFNLGGVVAMKVSADQAVKLLNGELFLLADDCRVIPLEQTEPLRVRPKGVIAK